MTLDLGNIGIGSIQYDDGYSGRIKGGLFDGLTSLETLNLSHNRFYPKIDDDAFRDLVDLTELDLRGFSRNPAGRSNNNDLQCWSDEEKAQTREKYPWNARIGSPLAFAPLTSLVTYNYDADFDTRVSGYDYTPRAYATNNYTQPPDAPVSLGKSVSGNNVVTITWSAPPGESGITGYIIERSVNNLGAGKNSCPKRQGDSTVFWYFEWHDALGNEQGRPTSTSFTDDIGGSDLLKNGRTIWSLKYHVYTVANNARSMPATIEVGALQRSGQ